MKSLTQEKTIGRKLFFLATFRANLFPPMSCSFYSERMTASKSQFLLLQHFNIHKYSKYFDSKHWDH